MNEKIIKCPVGVQRKLAKELAVSEVTVWKALTYRSNSPLATKIRKAALMEKMGGKIYIVEPRVD